MLHLLGFDHELSDEAEEEMVREEELLLNGLGWKGKGLIQSAGDAGANENPHFDHLDGNLPKSNYMVCPFSSKLSLVSTVVCHIGLYFSL